VNRGSLKFSGSARAQKLVKCPSGVAAVTGVALDLDRRVSVRLRSGGVVVKTS
jgi:hypothetical protein